MNEIIPFDYESTQVRVIERQEEPWFVLADLCKVLGIANPRNVSARLDDELKNTVRLTDGIQRGNPNVTIVNESGMYEVILRSDAPNAKPFRRWVTSEVLPTIRKTGTYGVPQLTGPALMAAALQEADRTMKELEARASKSETQLDMIEGTSGFSIRQFHKHYFPDVPEREFFELLYRKRLLIDQRGTRGRDKQGKLKNGYEHKHPAAAGKPFFFLDSPYMDQESGRRYYQTKVRPGRPEADLAQLLTSWGLAPNPAHVKEIAA